MDTSLYNNLVRNYGQEFFGGRINYDNVENDLWESFVGGDKDEEENSDAVIEEDDEEKDSAIDKLNDIPDNDDLEDTPEGEPEDTIEDENSGDGLFKRNNESDSVDMPEKQEDNSTMEGNNFTLDTDIMEKADAEASEEPSEEPSSLFTKNENSEEETFVGKGEKNMSFDELVDFIYDVLNNY